MPTQRKWILLLVAILIVLATSWYLYSLRDNGESPDVQSDRITLRLKWTVTAGFAGDYYAEKLGYFEAEGLDVGIKTGGPQANPINLVGVGEEEIGVAGADAILTARANGVPVVAIGAIYQQSGVGFFTKEGSNINSPEDWRGRKVGVIAGNDTETIFRALLIENGLSESDVTEIPIGFDLTPFLTGTIDVQPGYIPNQPNLLKKQGINVNIIDPSDYGVNVLGNVYFTTEDFLSNNPEIVQRFLAAVVKGWKSAIENPEAAVNALIEEDPNLDFDTQLAVLQSTIPFLQRRDARFGIMDSTSWQKTAKALSDVGLLETDVSIESTFTNRYLPYNN